MPDDIFELGAGWIPYDGKEWVRVASDVIRLLGGLAGPFFILCVAWSAPEPAAPLRYAGMASAAIMFISLGVFLTRVLVIPLASSAMIRRSRIVVHVGADNISFEKRPEGRAATVPWDKIEEARIETQSGIRGILMMIKEGVDLQGLPAFRLSTGYAAGTGKVFLPLEFLGNSRRVSAFVETMARRVAVTGPCHAADGCAIYRPWWRRLSPMMAVLIVFYYAILPTLLGLYWKAA